jgi:hypothetical protein
MICLPASPKEILLDDSGWGDLILGVVIGALALPSHRYMEHRISVTLFQSPRFERKEYLDKTVSIIQRIIKVMHADKTTRWKVCSGYVLSAIRRFLDEQGYQVEKVKVTGELQRRVEYGFVNWCIEVGVPQEALYPESGKNRFQSLFRWVKENPKLRENLVKTGWKSWNKKWRKLAYENTEAPI